MNNATLINLEFIHFVPLHPGVYPRCKLTCFPVGGPFETLPQPAQSPGIRLPRKRNSTKEYVRIYKLFMQNKANFGNDKISINTFVIMRYVNLIAWLVPKNKANSNPIQTQFNPKQTQFNPIQSQFKPNLTQNKANLSQYKPNLSKGQK